jgi:hypothetical protein
MNPLKRVAPIIGLVAAAGLAACGSDKAAGPESVNVGDMSNGLSGVASEFTGNAVFQSLANLSFYFTVDTTVSAAVRASAPFGVSDDPKALTAAARQHREAMRVLTSLAPGDIAAFFPQDVLGRTFAWDTAQNRYRISNLTGAPTNGVRFLLYVTNVTGSPVEPLLPLGFVDLTDEPTAGAENLGVLVKFGQQTVADYTISAVTTTSSFTLTASGSLFGSTGSQVDFALVSGESDVNGGTSTLDYHVAGSNGFSIDFDYSETATSASLDFRLAGDGNTLQMVASAGAAGLSGQIKFNGVTVATISGDPDNPTITGAGGRELTQQELAGLQQIFETAGELLLVVFLSVFAPAFFVFGSI